MNSQTFLYIIICILVLSNIYLFYKTRKIETNTGEIEGFAVTDDIIDGKIRAIYTSDIDAIRNLSNIAKKIANTNDTLNLPAGLTSMKGNAEIGGDTILYGNLTVKGNVKFENKDYGFIDIFPRFTIIAFYDSMVPKGWAPCNGKFYKLNDKGVAIETVADDGAYCPDLSSRMIIGAGKGRGLSERKRNDVGGFETHTLSVNEMPAHSHDIINILDKGFNCEGPNCAVCPAGGLWGSLDSKSGDRRRFGACARSQDIPTNTSTIGSGWPHPIMNPYFVTEYIMKL